MEQEIRKMAQKSEKSLNRDILDMIYHYTGFDKMGKRTPGESLRELAGGWSERDALEFQEAIKSSDYIGEEMWK